MIIYGSRAKLIAKEIVPGKCPHCGTLNSVEMNVFQRYAHVFWIPFFPVGKTGVSQCDHCKQVLKLKEMPADLRLTYDNLKGQAKKPVWMYTGLGLLAVLVTIGVISSKAQDEKNAKLIQEPRNGDVYEIKNNSRQYTLYKVAQVKGDSVFVYMNEYASNKLSGLSDIKRKGPGAYTEEMEPFTKAELKKMLDEGEIMDIERN